MRLRKPGNALKAGVLLVVAVAGLSAASVSLAASRTGNVVAAARQDAVSSSIVIEAKDAPIRLILEMLFKANRRDYSLEPDLGSITVKVTAVTVDGAIEQIFKAAPIISTVESGVTIVKLKPGQDGPRTVPVEKGRRDVRAKKVEDVTRRVAAVMFVPGALDNKAFPAGVPQTAIIETGIGDYRMVTEGYSIPSGLKKGLKSLTVKEIMPQGVTLETDDKENRLIFVPLRAAEAVQSK